MVYKNDVVCRNVFNLKRWRFGEFCGLFIMRHFGLNLQTEITVTDWVCSNNSGLEDWLLCVRVCMCMCVCARTCM